MSEEYEFTTIQDLVNEVGKEDKFSELKMVKKSARSKVTYLLVDISGVEEMFNKKGTIRKNMCLITHKEKGDRVVLGSYNKIKKVVFGLYKPLSKIGFKYELAHSTSKR